MIEWNQIPLSDIIDILGGGTPRTSVSEYWDGDIPWLTVSDFNNKRKYVYGAERHITKLGLENSSTKILNCGDVIISARGTVGVVSMLGKPMAFNQTSYGIRAKKGITTNDFVYYLLRNTVENLLRMSYGAVFDTITRKTFQEIIIKLPPLPEQRAIAGVLSSLDDKIDLLHRENETLEALAETLFRQWFIEEAEDDWEDGKIPDEFDFVMGLSPPGDTYNEDSLGTPMYQGKTDFQFRFPSRRVFTTAPKRFAEKYDTLISVRAPVGAQNMAIEKCCIGRGVAAFRYKKNPEYYSYTYYKLKSLMDQIKVFENTGTVFGSINKGDFENLGLVIPPFDLIDEYQKVVKPLDDKIAANTCQILTLESLRDTLLPKLMSGEVRVKYD
jgi:type I restriction enzyme S subunit